MIGSNESLAVFFEKLYEKYSRRVMNIVYGVLRDKDLAEEAFQLTFISVAQNITKVANHPRKEKVYIEKIARNKAISVYRKNSTIRKFEMPFPNDDGNDTDEVSIEPEKNRELEVESFEGKLFREYDRILLLESLDELDEKYSIYIREHYYGGMAYEEIAEKHGITKEVAKKRVYRSIDKLRKIFYAKGGTK